MNIVCVLSAGIQCLFKCDLPVGVALWDLSTTQLRRLEAVVYNYHAIQFHIYEQNPHIPEPCTCAFVSETGHIQEDR